MVYRQACRTTREGEQEKVTRALGDVLIKTGTRETQSADEKKAPFGAFFIRVRGSYSLKTA